MFEFTGSTVSQKWRNKDLAAHITTPVVYKGLAFGPHGDCDKGPLRCIDWKSGALKWESRDFRGGSLVLAGDELVVVTSKGELVIGPAAGSGFEPRTRFTLPKGRYWAQPTVNGGAIYLRSNKGEVTCLR
jgi:hypothetical protein